MSEPQIIKAVAAQWNGSTALRAITLRSTRIPPGTANAFPYALVETQLISRRFWSGDSQLTSYIVTLTVYGGQSKGTLDAIEGYLTALFALNIGLPVLDCYVISAMPASEDVSTSQPDWYGEDSSELRQSFRITLNEKRPAVNSTLAT